MSDLKPHDNLGSQGVQSAYDRERALEPYNRVFAKQYERAAAYTKGIVTVGYAVIFGIWSFTKQQMTPGEHALAGILLLTSAGVFAIWEVVVNLRTTAIFKRWARALESPTQEVGAAIVAFDDANAIIERRWTKYWYAVVATTLLTGCGAVLAMFRALLITLVAGPP